MLKRKGFLEAEQADLCEFEAILVYSQNYTKKPCLVKLRERREGRKGLFRLCSQFHVLVCTLYSGDSNLSDMII